ncbi:MAG TPA: Nif3-like dinuclear metal center hexameric protein [Gemmatimonadaceae bacterium]|nr:Nif3-like dinuclear metal center hexameric protein [Gemmatimonadaceae bacterium]
MATLYEISHFLDALLATDEIPDYANALNGLQVESDRDITKVAAAVDVSDRTIRGAIDAGASLLLVHHGLFWGGLQPLRGSYLGRVRLLLDNKLALYASHLPLDAHTDVGNNVLLARELGLTPTGGFARFQTVDIGVMGHSELPTAELVSRADAFARRHGGSVRTAGVTAGRLTSRWAICTGAGADIGTLREATTKGIDTLIVGEGPHWTAVDASERGLAIIYAGHYATETLGVRAIADRVSTAFGIPSTFIPAPTGF